MFTAVDADIEVFRFERRHEQQPDIFDKFPHGLLFCKFKIKIVSNNASRYDQRMPR
jgi:hypothetical protein